MNILHLLLGNHLFLNERNKIEYILLGFTRVNIIQRSKRINVTVNVFMQKL